jgi:hypothetical protein
MLKVTGKAAVVLPDNVLFEGGAGEKYAASCWKPAMCTPCCAYPRAFFTRRA